MIFRVENVCGGQTAGICDLCQAALVDSPVTSGW